MRPGIGWIGLGHMGSVMAPRLAAVGWTVTGYDLDPARAAGCGVAAAATPVELAAGADVLISTIPDDAAFRALLAGLAGALRPGTTLIDMSTLSPDASARAADLLDKAGVAYLRAPVSGSTGLAAEGALSLFVSGPRDVFEAQHPILEVLGKRITWLGPAEEARVAKLVVNSLVGSMNGALAEALALAEACGLNRPAVIDLIAGSAAASPYIASKVEKLKERDWTPAASISLIAKDLDLVLALAEARGLAMPQAALNRARLAEAEALGWGGRDMSALAALPTREPAVTIAALEDERYAAMLAGDIATLDRLLDTTLRYIHSSGGTDSKESYIAGFASGHVRYRHVTRSGQSIQVSGDAALVLSRLGIDILVGGKPKRIEAMAMAVWSRTSGRWRLICVQSAPAGQS
ncbi:NAD-binding protein [Azospirillum sp. RWY-5-1]|uniref:NAD-binding protein n=1 Tax=Azospirillum oleiclasticum TaxID=2735135 RepID=A0ABX2TMJ3_9PROT|nr:NAD(P)-binding domain-containing protein [Azospirillum oleiclasticum]NYZ17626.1 NAD-binding protein [Azospirillum oleiclasticum]NYZ24906.1 NAD-binding protein [Azospirillum oleiclasticum]